MRACDKGRFLRHASATEPDALRNWCWRRLRLSSEKTSPLWRRWPSLWRRRPTAEVLGILRRKLRELTTWRTSLL
jgi:hypothetical protein